MTLPDLSLAIRPNNDGTIQVAWIAPPGARVRLTSDPPAGTVWDLRERGSWAVAGPGVRLSLHGTDQRIVLQPADPVLWTFPASVQWHGDRPAVAFDARAVPGADRWFVCVANAAGRCAAGGGRFGAPSGVVVRDGQDAADRHQLGQAYVVEAWQGDQLIGVSAPVNGDFRVYLPVWGG